jgi:peptidoglycan/xylan/chitin deacetylase (PgdA/CDA1 family)
MSEIKRFAKRALFACGVVGFARATAGAPNFAPILRYHSVGDQGTYRSPTIALSPADFDRQMAYLAKHYNVLPLERLLSRVRCGDIPRNGVAITFDDGYGDNMLWAVPELIRRSIPCTYFVSTDFVENKQPFPHDIQCGTPLRPNSIAEIREMADAGIQIGGHTRSHLDLGLVWSQDRLRSELCDSRKKLQDWTGQPVDYFAFPYGLVANISQEAIDMLVEAGYQAFVSAFGAWNFPIGDAFHLTRFHGDPCTEAIRNWLTLDPRRIESSIVLDYRKPVARERGPELDIQPVAPIPFPRVACTPEVPNSPQPFL